IPVDERWIEIGFVPGFGTTTEKRSYSFTDNNLATGSYSYRLKQIDYNGTVEYSNEVFAEVGAPEEFSLSQNYPNPFNPVTKIKFTIPTPPSSSPLSKGRNEVGFVTLKIYDILGNEVATLVNEYKPAGTYEVEFNSHSDEGQNLSSGVYYYQLKSGSFISTKKMILLK
ncbi:MAG TPA: FlgD immunoglobulin-like domain containing protein, partial [Ignavibacteriaceae bacterium]|nr:FlgD immunoglobulin-like domain containing protein [Ignavibacteriaceae bacterium]